MNMLNGGLVLSLAVTLGTFHPAALAGVTSSPAEGVAVNVNEAAHRVDVTVDGKPFTSYLWETNQRKPVLYPLVAPDGTTVTRGYPFQT